MTATRQEERSRATKQRLLDATVECLVDLGWSGTTTTVVCERAGVSRGAQLHHYPTKADLVLAALERLSDLRTDLASSELDGAPEGGTAARVDRTVDLVVGMMTGPLFMAAIELWVAARTDAGLRERLVPIEAKVGRELHLLVVAMLGADEARPHVREAVQATLDLARGLGVAALLTDDTARRTRLLAVWKQQLTAILNGADRG